MTNHGEVMHEMNVILADLPGLGRVRLCECNSVHVSIGPVTINLEPTAFQQLADLMTSATERLSRITESCDEGQGAIRVLQPLQSRTTN